MTPDDFGLMLAILGGTCALAALLGWRGGDARRDVALLGSSGVAFGTLSALLFAA